MQFSNREIEIGNMALAIRQIGPDTAYSVMFFSNPPIQGWIDFTYSLILHDIYGVLKDKPVYAMNEDGELERLYVDIPYEELTLSPS